MGQILTLDILAEHLGQAPLPWWLSGLRALHKAAGYRERRRGEFEITILRKDQYRLRRALTGWEFWTTDGGEPHLWGKTEILHADVHTLICRPSPDGDATLTVRIEESRDACWFAHWSPQVGRPLEELGEADKRGVRYLAPELQLFRQAETPDMRDERDLTLLAPVFSENQLTWLIEAIEAAYGSGHAWRQLLGDLRRSFQQASAIF